MSVVSETTLGSLSLPAHSEASVGRRAVVDLVAGNDLALHWLQTPPATVASMAELRLVAQTRCAQLFGGTPGGWRIAADWRIDRPFVCAALPHETATLVDDRLAASLWVARWHSGWSIVASRMAPSFPDDGWSALRTPASVMMWHCRAGAVNCLASWPSIAAQPGTDEASRALQQMTIECSRIEHAPMGDLYWLDMTVSSDDLAAAARLARVRVVQPPPVPLIKHAPMTEASVALRLSALLGGDKH